MGYRQRTTGDIASEIQQDMGNLPAGSFKNGNANLANAFISKVQAVGDLIAAADAEPDAATRAALYQEVIDKIENDLMKKCDANPQGNWITNTADAQTIYDLLVELRDAVLARMNS